MTQLMNQTVLMSEEYLDIVDENGNLTGERELRSVCHAKGLWHRTVRIYLFRKRNDEIELLIHSFLIKKRTNPSMWTASFGGHIKALLPNSNLLKTEQNSIKIFELCSVSINF